ncbi:MAG: hypothetical protein PWQ79_1866 [Thermococcaceae archaeon]|nr:hypothetical protein [Thermococcaceae archaeon]MDK2914951.1 hypothetical protein [Thermococcaceae archaeon]
MPKSSPSRLVTIFERLLPTTWLKRYELLIYSADIDFLASEYLLISLLLGVIAGAAVGIFNTLYGIGAFAGVFFGMAYLYPYWRINKRIEDMEKRLPDAFFYLASSLRAGISFSEALEELATANFGALTKEFRRTVSEIKRGRPTNEALLAFALRNKKSPVIYRSMMIIMEALERGAPLGDVLVSVANDVRDLLRIKQERKASTGMQTMFFIIMSGFIGPLILGIVTQLMGVMTSEVGNFPIDTVRLILLGFVVAQAVVSGLGIGVIREGKFSAGVRYSALLLVLGVVIFNVATKINISM